MTTMTRRGTYSSFTINKNDRPLMAALRRLQPKGEKSLDGLMAIALREKTREVKTELKKMAGPLASVSVPSPRGLPYGKSKNIHTKVADALKVHKTKKMEYTVHTGDSIREAEVGVLGQRGGKIAHIVAKGMDSFRYGNLPYLVMSSTRWYMKTGQAGWISTGMRLRAWHPGFSKTMDYIGEIQKRAVQQIEDGAKWAIRGAAIASGFSAQESMAMNVGSTNIRTNTGGTGK